MTTSFNPMDLMQSSIANFTSSPEIALLEHLLSDPTWPQHPDAAKLLSIVCINAEALDLFTTKLAKVTAELAQKKLTPEFWYRDDSAFDNEVSAAIGNCVKSAYGRKPQPADIESAYGAVVIRGDKRNNVIASTLVNFRTHPENTFKMNMEAVQRNWQRKGVATALFKFTEVVVEYLMNADRFVRINLGSGRASILESLKDHAAWDQVMINLCVGCSLMLESCVDHDAPEWHGVMMHKLGFSYDGCMDDDLIYSMEIHSVPH